MPSSLLDGDPRQLGGYWLARRVGAGGQGVVYEGYDADGCRVAVKALHADSVGEALRNGLRKEVAALLRVAPFCTARVVAADLDGASPYIVSEYVPGPDLRDWVEERGACGPQEVRRLAIGIATALASIHRAGIVHRDLKPANVLLGPDGPRVIDFGIAKTDEMSRSATSGLKGTPRWMAPELFRGQRATAAVDVWAWAVIVLFAATGRPPFDGDSLPGLMHQVLNDRPRTDALAEPLRGLVEQALSREPGERPASRQLLEGLLEEGSGEVLEAGKRAAAEEKRLSIVPAPSLGDLAEQSYRRLGGDEQRTVPRILLRMVDTPSDPRQALRAVPVGDFADGVTDESLVRRILDDFTTAGLLRWDGDAVTLNTPALLRAWPRLAGWLTAERDGLGAHRALVGAARRWSDGGRKPADLYQGSVLDGALAWASSGRQHLTLNLAERAFLDASVRQTHRRVRARSIVIAALAVLLVIAAGAGTAATVQSRSLRKTNATIARQRDTAIGRQLAKQAVELRRADPLLARRLAVAASALAGDTFEAREALLTLSSQWEEGDYRPTGVNADWHVQAPGSSGPYVWWEGSTVILADPATQQVIRTLAVPGAPVTSAGLVRDGKRIFTAQDDGTLAFWDVATGARTLLPFKAPAGNLTLSPTGSRIAVIPRKGLEVLDTATGKVLFAAEKANPNGDPVFSPDEQSLISVNYEGSAWELTGFDLRTSKPIQLPKAVQHVQEAAAVAFSPDGRRLAVSHVAGHPNQFVVVDLANPRYPHLLQWPKHLDDTRGSLTFSPNGRFLASGMTLWGTDRIGPTPPAMSANLPDYCGPTRFSADGQALTCTDTQSRVQSVDVTPFVRPVVISGMLAGSAISSDGTTLAAVEGWGTGAIAIWDTATATLRTRLPMSAGGPGARPGLSPDGKLLAIARDNGSLEIWDTRSRTRRSTIETGPVPLEGSPPPSFSPDGRAVATLTPATTGQPSELRFWDTTTARLLGHARAVKQFDPEHSDAMKIVWSADGRRVYSANDLGAVAFPSGKALVPPNAHATTVQALSRQDILVTMQDRVDHRSMAFFDARTLKQIGADVPAPNGDTPIAALSPDGRLLATTDGKDDIDLWDVAGRRRIGLPLTGHTPAFPGPQITSLAFSSDGSHLYSVADDGKLLTHTIAPRLLKTELCAHAGALTRQQWSQYAKDTPYRKTC